MCFSVIFSTAYVRKNLIFERFYKADKSRSSDKKSTGLGLPIVKKILQNHGQNISVESAPGQGSCFTFTLDEEAN